MAVTLRARVGTPAEVPKKEKFHYFITLLQNILASIKRLWRKERTMITWQDLHHSELTVPQLYALLKLRCAVFVVEQNCPYLDVDGDDLVGENRHILGWHEGGTGGVCEDSEKCRRSGTCRDWTGDRQ
ncbi:hypothetical protein PYX06_21280 [Citrobacter amalonaticus]|nr:hypothetical protein [Citrobacter amalonaticus]